MFKAIYGGNGSLSQGELETRKRALRNLVTGLGWWTLTAGSCYIILYLIVKYNSEGPKAFLIQIMTISTLPIADIRGVALIYGASQQRRWVLEVALWFTLIQGVYESALGFMGATHFIHTTHLTMHFLLLIVYISLSLSLLRAIFFDIFLLNAYRNCLVSN